MIELLEIEHECMLRGACGVCDRNCAECKLVQDAKELHEMYTNVIALLKEQETTFEKDGHHIRCTNCGNYWCDTDREGNLFPHNYCPECGKAVKRE